MPDPIGAVMRRLDSAWRLTMPDQLLESYPNKLILTPGFDNCIRAYGPKQYEELDCVLKKLDANDPDEADYLRFFRALSTTVTLDGNARFRFSDAHMSWLGVGLENRDIMVFDAGGYLEFWEVDRWNEFMKEKAAGLKDLARRIFGKRQEKAEEGSEDDAGTPSGDGQRNPELP